LEEKTKQFGPPAFEKRRDEFDLHPLLYTDGKSADWLTGGAGTSGVHYTLDLKKTRENENAILSSQKRSSSLSE